MNRRIKLKFKFGRSRLPVLIGIVFGGVTSSCLIPAQAAELTLGSDIQFPEDTTLDFDFRESHGVYQSTFGVLNLETQEKTPLIFETKPSDQPQSVTDPSSYTDNTGGDQDFLGTPGNAVPEPRANFLFKANTPYSLYLDSLYESRPAGTIYSTDALNPGGEELGRRVVLEGDLANACTEEGALIRWDDTGASLVDKSRQDRDFDDFILGVAQESCAIGGGGLPGAIGGVPAAGGGGGFNLAPLGALAGLIPLAFLGGGSDDAGPPPAPVEEVTPPPPVGETPPPPVTPPGEVTPPGSETPPVVIPPGSETPPVVTPPGSGTPPVITPPGSETPPVVTPPGSGTPPVVTPPGSGTPPDSEPVPEPSSTLGLGLAGAFGVWLKKRRAKGK